MSEATGPKPSVQTQDGLTLQSRYWLVDSPRASVVIVHGYMEHSARYEHLAGRLNEEDLSVYAFDLRGHGRSGGVRGPILGFSQYLEDLDLFLHSRVPSGEDTPTFLLGHSLGGLIVTNYVLHHRARLRGVVLSSPFFGSSGKIPASKIAMGRVMSVLFPTFSSPTGLRPEWLSHDPDVGRAYQQDPLVFDRATARWFTETTATIKDTRKNARSFALPCLLLQAGADRIADPKLPKQIFDQFSSTQKDYIEYPGLSHVIFNETEKENVIRDLRTWIAKRLK